MAFIATAGMIPQSMNLKSQTKNSGSLTPHGWKDP